jgi:AhpD family alkylhydroperoxidase
VLNKTVKHVATVSNRDATGTIRAVYDQARREIGMLPDAVTMFTAAAPELAAATWAPFRETLLSTGHASRAVKEAVAARVSALNKCPYCVDAHTIMLYGSGNGDFATSIIEGGELTGDPELLAAAEWAATVMTRPTSPVRAPFPAEQVPEMVGTLVEFHFLNRVIDVLLNGTFLPGPDRAKRIARKVTGKIMAKRIRSERAPGESAGLVRGLPLPADLSWAAPSPAIADAFASLAAASANNADLPASVLSLVERTLDGWDGLFPGPSRAWLTSLVASLPVIDQPAGRLALLTALAPFQATDEDVLAFREQYPDDEALLGVLTWSAFAAARRIGAWSVPAPQRV